MNAPTALAELLQPAEDFDARPVVEHLVLAAQRCGGSDLHLRPTPKAVEVLMRRDGVLQHKFDLPAAIYERLLVGLKNMAKLASYKKSTPQDGRLHVADVEVRVATAPTHFGEKVVLRLVRAERRLLALDELGLLAPELQRVQTMVAQPQGLVLATGPAGSGKTTTLYAAMRWLYQHHARKLAPDARLNVVTLEDPVECVVEEFTQTQMQPAAGMTFASGLRSLLRQDPEVILVGEIRDAETAAAAVQCSLTGHLVLSTLHARDSVGVVPRLLEMGIEPYLLSASLSGVLYQRLVRRLCVSCRREKSAEEDLVKERVPLGLPAGPSFSSVGCDACEGSGYNGRTAVAEVLLADDKLRQGILDRLPLWRLREESGLVPLRTAALSRVADATTSYAEVCRVCPA